MIEHLKKVKAHEVKPGDAIHLVEAPKQVRSSHYLKDNTTIQFTFQDGSNIKVDQFVDVLIERREHD